MSDQPKIPLADAIRALRAELAQAVEEGENEDVRFQVGPVELEFQVEVSNEAEAKAGIAFWLVTAGAGGSRRSGTTNVVKINLQPVDADGNPIPVSGQVPFELK